jgi:hypothetical protein
MGAARVLNVDEGLAAALVRLEASLTRSGAAIVPLLHPGIGEREVVATLQGIGLTPSAEVVTWFGWHNGAGEQGVPTSHIKAGACWRVLRSSIPLRPVSGGAKRRGVRGIDHRGAAIEDRVPRDRRRLVASLVVPAPESAP